MARPPVEVADIFRAQGPAWRLEHAGQISLGQLKVMTAIERCRCAGWVGTSCVAGDARPHKSPTTRAPLSG